MLISRWSIFDIQPWAQTHTSPLRLTQFKPWRKCCQTNSICLVSWLLRGSSTSSAEVIPTFSASQILILVDLPLSKCNWTTSIMHTSHGIATSTLVAFLWWASNNRNSSSQLLSSKQFLYRTEQERVRYPTYCRHVKSTSQYCPQSLIGKTMGTLIGYSVGSWHCSINISTIHHHLRHQRITTQSKLIDSCSQSVAKVIANQLANQTSNIVCSLFNISTSWSFSFFSSLDGDIENIPQSPLCVYLRYIYRYISHVESDMQTCGTLVTWIGLVDISSSDHSFIL